MHSLSVITPTYNKAHLLDLTLASYLHQTYERFELVIVDDGSTDNTREVVERYQGSLNLQYIHQPNQGRSAARNAAIQKATGDIIVFADDDRLAAPGFLAAHARGFSSPSDNTLVQGGQEAFLSWWEPNPEFVPRVAPLLQRHPELAPVLNSEEKRQLVSAADIRERFAETLEKFRLEETWWERCKRIVADSGDINSFRIGWMIGTTGNLSVSRQRLIEVGMFDESFSKWGMEDTELCFRLCQAGAKIVVSEEALNYHQLHARSPTWHEEWHRNFAHFWSKHDSVQIPLYYLYTRRLVTPAQVNSVVNECEQLERDGRPALVNELKRLYRMSVLTLQAVHSMVPVDSGGRFTTRSTG